MLNKQMVKCSSESCEKKGIVMNYNDFITNHIKDHKTVPCHEECEELITFNTIEEHFEKCNLVVISCEKCHERCFREDIETHK